MTEAPAIPLVDLQEQHAQIGEEIESRVREVLRSGQYVGGPEVEALEEEFARYCGVSYAVSVNSGTAALHTALLALGLDPGDEVITVAHTFVATAEAIVAAGAKPVFVDIDAKSYTMDAAQLEAAITPRTRAIIPVHLYGQPAELDPILGIAEAAGLAVIEDACQAHGATYRGSRVGSLGAIGCFSFYPSKNLGAAGEGGIAVTDSPLYAERMRRIRDHGQSGRYRHEVLGFNYRLPALQAAVLRVKLRRLDDWNEMRRAHALEYGRLLSGSAVTIPWERPESSHVYHLYVIRSETRDKLKKHLSAQGVATGIHYPLPAHLQPPYRQYGAGPDSLPETEAAAATVLSLPMYPELQPGQLKRVTHALRAFSSEPAAVS